MEKTEVFLVGWIGGSAIAGLSWFFSTRRRLFIRVFVARLPRDQWREAIRNLSRDTDFQRGTRAIALIQFGFATLFGLAWLWLSLF